MRNYILETYKFWITKIKTNHNSKIVKSLLLRKTYKEGGEYIVIGVTVRWHTHTLNCYKFAFKYYEQEMKKMHHEKPHGK